MVVEKSRKLTATMPRKALKVVNPRVDKQLFGPQKLSLKKGFGLSKLKKVNLNLTQLDQNTGSQSGNTIKSGLGSTGYIMPLSEIPTAKLYARSAAQTGNDMLSASVAPQSAAQPRISTMMANRAYYIIPESQIMGSNEDPPEPYRKQHDAILIEPPNQDSVSIKQGVNTDQESKPGLPVQDPISRQEFLQPQGWHPMQRTKLSNAFRKLLGSNTVNGKWRHRQAGTMPSSNQEALIQTSVHNYIWSNQKHQALTV